MSRKRALVLGGGGFIGNHLVGRLKQEGAWVRAADRTAPSFGQSTADEFVIADLREADQCLALFDQAFDEVFQLAAEMGGAGYIFVRDNDLDVVLNSGRINFNVAQAVAANTPGRLLFTSSACVYNQDRQRLGQNYFCREADAYPAYPDSEYGWEKLMGERLYTALGRKHGAAVRIGRLHNVYGPNGAWRGGREKAPAAICRKVAEAAHGGSVPVWGDGKQMRSFLYIDDCLDGLLRLMRSDVEEPLNIGSAEVVSITELTELVIGFSGKTLGIDYVPGPIGVGARSSDNTLCKRLLGWEPQTSIANGLQQTYRWIESQVCAASH